MMHTVGAADLERVRRAMYRMCDATAPQRRDDAAGPPAM